MTNSLPRGIFAFFLLIPMAAYSQESISLQYKLLPGMDLVYDTTLELAVEGGYSEQSVRRIETRFIVNSIDASGAADIVGLSRMILRELEGQSVEAPFGNFQAYRFQFNPNTRAFQPTTPAAEYGTGWSPMANFPAIPNQITKSQPLRNETYPIYAGFEPAPKGAFSVRAIRVSGAESIQLSYTLDSMLAQAETSANSVEYQEKTVEFNLRTGLPVHTKSATQMQIKGSNEPIFVDLNTESHLVQANIFQTPDLASVQNEIQTFFRFRNQLQNLDDSQSEKTVNDLMAFSANSRLPFMREAAKDLILRHRYDLRLDQNRKQTEVDFPAPAIAAKLLDGSNVQFPAENRATVALFWALWWEPSEQALLDMKRIREEMKSDKIDWIAINLDTQKSAAHHYLTLSGIDIPTAWDEGYPREGAAFTYGIRRIPSFIVIDRKGKIIAREISEVELRNIAKRLR